MPEHMYPLAEILDTDLVFVRRPGDDKLYYVTGAVLNSDVINATPDATTAVKGKVELATTTESAAGSASTVVVTPAGLAAYAPAATTTTAGKVELATTTEAAAGSSSSLAVTPEGLATYVPAASEIVAGKVELATRAEAAAGTSSTTAVTPDGLTAYMARGTHAVTSTEASANTVSIVTGLSTAAASLVAVMRSNVDVKSDAVITLSGGTLAVADGSTFNLAESDVVSWIVF